MRCCRAMTECPRLDRCRSVLASQRADSGLQVDLWTPLRAPGYAANEIAAGDVPAGLTRPVECAGAARCFLHRPPTPSPPARGASAGKPARRSLALPAGFPRDRPPPLPAYPGGCDQIRGRQVPGTVLRFYAHKANSAEKKMSPSRHDDLLTCRMAALQGRSSRAGVLDAPLERALKLPTGGACQSMVPRRGDTRALPCVKIFPERFESPNGRAAHGLAGWRARPAHHGASQAIGPETPQGFCNQAGIAWGQLWGQLPGIAHALCFNINALESLLDSPPPTR